MITHLEPDILECEVKQALRCVTMNKANGGDGIPVELLQILKDDAVKVCTQYASKFGKFSSGHRTGKGQFSFQSQKKGNAGECSNYFTSRLSVCLQCRRPRFDPWVRKIPGEGNGNPLQYPCLENPMDGGAWEVTVHGVTKSRTQLNDFTFTC